MESLGRYRIDEEIARGAYGIVYRALDLELERIVALKMLRLHEPTDNTLERFFREARTAASLNHPGIVKIYESGLEGGRAYFVMEFLEGRTVADRIAAGPIPPSEIVTIGVAVARALDYAHRRGVVHRDVKPSNIMLTSRGPVLTDFGVAWSALNDRLTQTGELVGTPLYMSPEVISRGAKAADARSDVYSLGAVLYEMVLGKPPFDAANFLELSSRILHDEPAPLPVLGEPILRCLSKDMDHRFPTAAALADALRLPPRAFPRLRTAVVGTVAALSIGTAVLLGVTPEPPAMVRKQTEPRLRVTSMPAGATVLLDGERIGSTPLEVPVPSPGPHSLRFQKVGCVEQWRHVEAAGQDLDVQIRLYTPGEIPEGMVARDGLFIDADPVTMREYDRFLRVSFRTPPPSWRRGRLPKGSEDRPVTGVTWEDAAAYARWCGKRLPTIAELEHLPSEFREWTADAGVLSDGGRVCSDSRSPIIGFRCVME